jgi:hypothetical protein
MLRRFKGLAMVPAATLIGALVLFMLSTPVSAYTLSGDGCNGNGNECKVWCNNGSLAGSMYWNGTVWTDGDKWDADKDTEAKKICAANGTACV